jgi:hypothetical protein
LNPTVLHHGAQHKAVTTQPRTAAYAMAAIFTTAMLWFTAQGFMWLDDYELQAIAYQAPWLSLDYLTQPWGGHFMPAGFALAQVLAKTTPFTYVPIVAMVTLGMGLFSFGSARLFLFLLGNRWAALVPLGLILASGAIWDAATWWIAALNAVPLLAAIPFATRWHLIWLRDGSFRDGVLAWLTTTAACLFFEKALGLVAFLALITIALRGQWQPRRQRKHSSALLVAYVATAVGVAAAYLLSTTGTVAQVPDLATATAFLREGGLSFPPLLMGGPWSWSPPGLSATPVGLEILALTIVLVIALCQAVRSPRSALLWGGMLAYVLAVIAVVASGRAIWGVQVISQPRYFSEAVVYVVIVATLSYAYLDPTPSILRHAWRGKRVVGIAGGVLFAEVMILGLAATLPVLSRSLQANPSRVYVVGAIDSLAADEQPMLNGLVPGDVLWPLVSPRNQLRFFFSPTFGSEKFPNMDTSLTVLDAFGSVRPGRVVDEQNAPPDETCPWTLRSEETTVPLAVPLVDYWHTVRFSSLSGGPTSVSVSLEGGAPVSVPLSAGLQESYVFLDGQGDTLTFSRVPDGTGVCIGDLSIGFTAEVAP